MTPITRYTRYRTDIGDFIESLLAVATVQWEFGSSPARSTHRSRALLSMLASSSPAQLVTSAGPSTAFHIRSSRLDIYFHHQQLKSQPRPWKNRPWSLGAHRQHCPHAIAQFFLYIRLVFATTVFSEVDLTNPLMELCGIEYTTTL